MRTKYKIFKIGVILITLLCGVMVVWGSEEFSMQQEMKAASGFSTGDQVYIGNESYTVIDPNAMTLLADRATDAGEVTWAEANTSLSTLPAQYGELGAVFVQDKFSLPTTEDLASITDTETSSLTTINPIASDWWLGDASVDNRSKFVGANTNSLITDIENVKNYINDKNVCLKEQTVIEQGVKPTETGVDPDTDKTYTTGTYHLEQAGVSYQRKFSTYEGENCVGLTVSAGESIMPWSSVVFDYKDGIVVNPTAHGLMMQIAIDNFGLDIEGIYNDPTLSYEYKPEIKTPFGMNQCFNISPVTYNGKTVKSIKSHINEPGCYVWIRKGPISVRDSFTKTVTCEGNSQTAGISSVRPLITLSNDTVAYTSSAKPAFQSNTQLSNSIPSNQGESFLTVRDNTLNINLDSNNSRVKDNRVYTDMAEGSTIVSIPVSLGGYTSGTRYVSAQATTTSGESYSVLGSVNGATGIVDLDISNFPNYDTADSLSLTLYQEVDEGTNTTYRGNGTQITLSMFPAITEITFTPSYPDTKTGWNYGDTGISIAGEVTGVLTFAGGTSGTKDEVTDKDYQSWEIVDEDGNTTTDTNFEIAHNKLQAKGKVPVGTYNLNVKVTDNNGETYTDTITIDVQKASNPFDWNDTVKRTSYVYYGDTLTLGITGVEEDATVTYGPSTHVSGTTFTAGKPTAKVEITASTPATTSYGETEIKHNLEIKKRPISVKTQLKDASDTWQDTVTISQGQALPDKQVVEDTSDSTSKGLAPSESSVTDAKLGTVTYEYRQGNTKVSDPSAKAGTYQLYAVYTSSEYYTVKVKAGTLIVTAPIEINDTNKDDYYEFKLSDGSTPDITKWQTEDIIIHPKHSDYNKMKVDDGSYQTGDQIYSNEGSNEVSLSFQNASGAMTSIIKETLKIDKTEPTITKVEYAEIDGANQSAGSGTFQYLFKDGMDIKVTAEDKESGIAKYKIVITPLLADGSVDTSKTPTTLNPSSTSSTYSHTWSEQGMFKVEVSVEDGVGRITNADPVTVKIKNTLTTLAVNGYINSDLNKPYDDTKWTNQKILLKLSASDHTALTNPQISTDGTTFQPMTDGEYEVDNTSTINDETYYFKATNIDGDEVSTSIQIKIDVDSPGQPSITYKDRSQNFVQAILNALTFDNVFTKEQTAMFTSNDAHSGIDHYAYVITETDTDGNAIGTPITGTGDTYDLIKNKNYKVEVTAYDKAGNQSDPVTKTIQIDTDAPTIIGVKDQSEYKQYYLPRYVSVEDNESGVKEAYYTSSDNSKTDIINEVRIMGTGSYTVYAEDNAGNSVTINFKIVELPDLDKVDGTDESYDIIDQIQKELDEIKDKIDQNEEDNYQKWIDDATEKWEESRRTIIEDNETTSKVEGQGGTNFDPRTELIVEEIPKEEIPTLPRNAIKTYDVYLMKGDTEIKPDGSIKVYLPYTEEADPIVYEIDEQGSVKEIPTTKENGYVTFVTDKLVKYAISNTEQKETKPDVCVVGPDKEAGTSDDVCGSDDSTKKDDGSVEVPNGGKVIFPDKEVDAPDGAIINPDGSVDFPDGTHYDPDGTKKDPEKQDPDTEDPVCVAGPDGKLGTADDICGNGNDKGDKPEKNPDGDIEVPGGGSIIFPGGNEVETPDGGIIHPDGSVTLPDGTEYDPNGDKIDHNGGKPDPNPDKDQDECKLAGVLLNIDSDSDGLPDLNLDTDEDCVADLNLDVDEDGIADVDIDSDGDGKADINVDVHKSGKAELNLALIKQWIPDKDDCVYRGFHYDTMADIQPYLNVDEDGDGSADRNVDDDGDGIPDRNIDADWFDKYGNKTNTDKKVNGAYKESIGGVLTGDDTKWIIWWLLFIGTSGYLTYCIYRKRHN